MFRYCLKGYIMMNYCTNYYVLDKGKLVMLLIFIYEMLFSGRVHHLGGGVYLMNYDILGMDCKCVFESLMC